MTLYGLSLSRVEIRRRGNKIWNKVFPLPNSTPEPSSTVIPLLPSCSNPKLLYIFHVIKQPIQDSRRWPISLHQRHSPFILTTRWKLRLSAILPMTFRSPPYWPCSWARVLWSSSSQSALSTGNNLNCRCRRRRRSFGLCYVRAGYSLLLSLWKRLTFRPALGGCIHFFLEGRKARC